MPAPVSRLSKHLSGEFTQTLPVLPAAGAAVRPSFRPSEEQCSIPRAKGRDGTESLQLSLVRMLASRTTHPVCRPGGAPGNGSQPLTLGSLTQMGLGLTWIPAPLARHPRVSLRRSHH